MSTICLSISLKQCVCSAYSIISFIFWFVENVHDEEMGKTDACNENEKICYPSLMWF